MATVGPAARASVLVVHGDPAVRRSVAGAIGPRATVVEAGELAAALDVLARGPVDVVLLDEGLGDVAFAVSRTRGTATEGHEPPVVVVLTEGEGEPLDRALRAGAEDLLRAPFAPVEVRTRVGLAIRLRAERGRSAAVRRALAARHAEHQTAEALHRAVVEATGDAVLTAGEDGVVRSANPAAALLFGAPSPTAVAGRRVTDLVALSWDEVAGGGGAPAGPVTVAGRGPGGAPLQLAARVDAITAGAERLLLVVLTDVGRGARAEESLRRQGDYVNGLVNSMQDGLLVIASGGRILQVNDRFLTMVGMSRGEVLSAPVPRPWWAPEAVAELPRRWEAVMRAGSGDIDTTYLDATGGRISVILGVAPLHDRDGRVVAHVTTVKDVTERRRQQERIHALAAEQTALARTAEAVAEGAEPEEIFALVAREAAALFGAQTGFVWRFEGREAELVGVSGDDGQGPGSRIPLAGEGPVPQVAQTGRAAQGGYPVEAGGARPMFRHGAAAPIHAGAGVWGCLHLASTVGRPTSPFAGTEVHISRFADLVGLAIYNAETRRELAERAASDPLTGLLNHRSFHERLRIEGERARRHGRGLALVMIDLDHFKRVNDSHGHPAGDAVLCELAHRLREVARAEDVLARVGGEEFAWIIPETDPEGAFVAAERAREAIAREPFGVAGRLSASLGVSGWHEAEDVATLLRMADEALYRAKAQGRDRVCRWAPHVGVRPEDPERDAAHQLSVRGVLALARAVEAKDAATRRHGIRVADLAVRLAAALDWSVERSGRLRDAGLIHDVGKIAIPDEVLRAARPLTPAETEAIRTHPRVGAGIAREVLDDEQTSWVLHQHERWDGRGWPGRLAGHDIPDGARILAVADAVDVLVARAAGDPDRALADALARCAAHAGTAFDPAVVEALARLHSAGAVPAA